MNLFSDFSGNRLVGSSFRQTGIFTRKVYRDIILEGSQRNYSGLESLIEIDIADI